MPRLALAALFALACAGCGPEDGGGTARAVEQLEALGLTISAAPVVVVRTDTLGYTEATRAVLTCSRSR